jgi:long-subunit fatty acid transport protein
MNDHSSALKANYFNTDQSLMHNFMDNYYQYGESSSYETLALETGLMYSYVANNDTIGPVTDPTFTMNYSDTASMDEIGVRQVKTIENKGSLGEYFLSISGNYAHKLYVGFSFGMQRVNFKSQDSHQEIDETNRIDQFDEITDFNSFKFTIHDERSGTGYNFKFGAIYKPTDFLRLGASYHSPTFFNLENIWYSSMVHNKNNYEINTAESSNKKFKYELTTPSKFLGGIAIKFKNIGLLSFDYERINYSQIELSASDEFTDFSSENNSYNQFLGNVNNFRAGGEIKLDHIYFRVGYSYYDSPYKDNYNNLHSATQIYSTGIGYREKSFFIDAAFSASFSEEKSYIFDTISNTTGLVPERVNMEKSRNKIILTAGLRF